MTIDGVGFGLIDGLGVNHRYVRIRYIVIHLVDVFKVTSRQKLQLVPLAQGLLYLIFGILRHFYWFLVCYYRGCLSVLVL